jgi:hypothetical protein
MANPRILLLQNTFYTGCKIHFNSTLSLGKATSYMDCLVKETRKKCLDPNNFKGKEGFTLS